MSEENDFDRLLVDFFDFAADFLSSLKTEAVFMKGFTEAAVDNVMDKAITITAVIFTKGRVFGFIVVRVWVI